MKEIYPNSPLLRGEIKKVDINNQKAEIIFRNGSYIKVVTATDSSRGSRATLLVNKHARFYRNIKPRLGKIGKC